MNDELRDAIYRAAVEQLKRERDVKMLTDAVDAIVELPPMRPVLQREREWMH